MFMAHARGSLLIVSSSLLVPTGRVLVVRCFSAARLVLHVQEEKSGIFFFWFPALRLPARTHPTHVRVAPPQSLVMVRELGLSILGWPPWPQLTVGDHRTVHPPPQLAPAQLTLGVRLSSGPMASLPIRSRPHAAAAPGRAPPHGGDRSRPQRQAWPTCPAHSAPTAPTQRDANGCHLRYEG